MSEEFDPKEYWENRLKKDYSLHGVGYIGHGEAYNRWMYKVRIKAFFRALRLIKLKKKEVSVLDIGSGTGFYINLWNKTGIKDVEGADITEVAVTNLKKNFPLNKFYHLDISTPEYAAVNEKKYFIVSIFDVLFHIVDDNKFQIALCNINKLLTENGYLILSDNFIHSPTYRGVHHVSRNIDDFYNALDAAGFKVIYRKPSFVFMNAPVDAKGRFIPWFWRFQEKLIYRNKKYGAFLGFLIYPFELFFTWIKREGPSTEIVICVKK